MKPALALLCSTLLSTPLVSNHDVDPARLDIAEIHRLDAIITSSYLIKHDFLRCFADGLFANMTDAAAVFATNHYVYSRNFIDYLQAVAAKIESAEISQPILENIHEERGNYEPADIATLAARNISAAWYDRVPHKQLSRRFFESLGIGHDAIPVLSMDMAQVAVGADGEATDCAVDLDDLQEETPGTVFTKYMMRLYATSNVCESLAIIGFAIEETVSRLYAFIWQGLRQHTPLRDEDVVFFPLHILIDDGHADLLKLGFRHYLDTQPALCADAEAVIREVLERRNQMYDDVRKEIEARQGASCSLPYRQLPSVTSNVHVDDAVQQAMREASAMKPSTWSLLQKMALAARILAMQGHGQTLSGQITCRADADASTIWVNVYGTPIDVVTVADFVRIDSDLHVLEGAGIVNKATRFHFHVMRARPDIQCLVHSHPPFTSALAMLGEPLRAAHMDTMAFFEDVQHLRTWPGIPFGDEEGEFIANGLGDTHWAALLAHHGLIVGGRHIEGATYRAWFFEHAATMQLRAMAAVGGDMARIQRTNRSLSVRARDWRASDGPVKAHFNGWSSIVLKTEGAPW